MQNVYSYEHSCCVVCAPTISFLMRIFTNGNLISQVNFFSGFLSVVFLDILNIANEAETRVLIGQPSYMQHMGLHKWLLFLRNSDPGFLREQWDNNRVIKVPLNVLGFCRNR